MDAAALDCHEAGAAGVSRHRDIVHRQTGAPVAHSFCFGGADGLAKRSAVISTFVGKFRRSKHVLGVNDEQEIVMHLQMDIPRVRGCRNVVHRARLLGVPHIENGESFGKHVADIGIPAMHHHLHGVGSATLVGVPDNAHVARVIRFRQLVHL
jgi:hypothetical protein